MLGRLHPAGEKIFGGTLAESLEPDVNRGPCLLGDRELNASAGLGSSWREYAPHRAK
jgi:hypothetical protein